MKKVYVLVWITMVSLLAGCSSNTEQNISSTGDNQNVTCENPYIVWENSSQILSLKAKVVSDKVKNVVANNGWIVSYLNCEPWMQVKANTLVAKIIPDWSDPNIKNLVNQKQSLENQVANTKNIIASTKSNFASQLNSLNIQKTNLENQIKISEQNLAKLEEQKKYWVGDLQTQIQTLKTQLQDLENSKAKLEQSKQADLTKLNQSIENTISSARSLLNNVFLKIDEIFGITDKNKNKNDAFENYLSAKNTALKEEIKNQFLQLYQQTPSTYTWWSDYLAKDEKLVVLVKQATSDSISSMTLPQTTIDTWFNLFSEYDNSLITLKNNLDNLIQSLQTVENNYDTQILNLQTQINSTRNNIENLEKNKLGSYTSSIDVQINQTKSQLDNTKASLSNILSQIDSLKSQENIQVKQLENQLSSLNASLKNILTSLSVQNIYAGVNWKVKIKKVAEWNKVWPGTLLCQIIPDKSSLKFQVFSSLKLSVPWKVYFDKNWKNCSVDLVSKLPYKDMMTQNNIYETNTIADCSGQKIQLIDLLTEWKVLNVNYKNDVQNSKISKVYIPLDYVVNKLTGQFVKRELTWWKIETEEVKLWNIDGSNVEILSWLKNWDKLCK